MISLWWIHIYNNSVFWIASDSLAITIKEDGGNIKI